VRRALLGDYAIRPDALAILPLRNVVVLPGMELPINVGRARSFRLAEWAAENVPVDVGVLTQRSPETEDPRFDNLLDVGTVVRIAKVVRIGPTNCAIVGRGVARFRVTEPGPEEPFLRASVERLTETATPVETEQEAERLREIGSVVLAGPGGEAGSAAALERAATAGEIADIIAGGIRGVGRAELRDVLEATDPTVRVRLVLRMLEARRTLPPPD